MSYLTQNEIAQNIAMQNRVAQAVAGEGIPVITGETANPDAWTVENRRTWAAAPGWADAWESAKVSHPPDPDAPPGTGYDPGADEAVITDGQILSQIQAMLG